MIAVDFINKYLKYIDDFKEMAYNKKYIIYGRRLSGSFNIRNAEESKNISYKKIKFVECRKTFLTTFAKNK